MSNNRKRKMENRIRPPSPIKNKQEDEKIKPIRKRAIVGAKNLNITTNIVRNEENTFFANKQATNINSEQNNDKIASLNKCFIECLCKIFNENKASNFADLFTQYKNFYVDVKNDEPKILEDTFSKLFGTVTAEKNVKQDISNNNTSTVQEEPDIETKCKTKQKENENTEITFDNLFKTKDNQKIFDTKNNIKFDDIFNKKE